MKEIAIRDLSINPMTMFGEEWCLAAAGNEANGYNAMTIAWGHLGTTWDRYTPKGKIMIPTAVVYIRPQRYTKEFFDREDLFTICSFAGKYKKALGYMGTHSGRDGDKVAKAGLTPVFAENTTYFAQASRVFICRKRYHAPLREEGFLDAHLLKENYPQHDYHVMYIGEILKVLEA